MSAAEYPYVGRDPLEERHHYTYVPFQGPEYLEMWRDARAKIRGSLGSPAKAVPQPATIHAPQGSNLDTLNAFEYLISSLANLPLSRETRFWREWVVQRFEVSKRIFPRYLVIGRRGKGEGDFRDLGLYLRFSEMLTQSYESDAHLPSLNALLKCLDILCSYVDKLDPTQKMRLARLIDIERQSVDILAKRPKGEPPIAAADHHEDKSRRNFIKGVSSGTKRFDDVVFLAADTARSRGYAQSLFKAGFRLPTIVVTSTDGTTRWGQNATPAAPPDAGSFPGLLIPNLRTPLLETCSMLAERLEIVKSGTINCDEVVSLLGKLQPKLVIYSGFGGELVKPEVLNAAGPFLHMHAGWLPDFRGSTTVYYSLLDRGGFGVSAILLTPEIDTGKILLRRWYPAPSCEVDFDYYHDSIYRSDALLEVLMHRSKTGKLPEGITQNENEGDVYYIIHPVLKHLAILGVRESCSRLSSYR